MAYWSYHVLASSTAVCMIHGRLVRAFEDVRRISVVFQAMPGHWEKYRASVMPDGSAAWEDMGGGETAVSHATDGDQGHGWSDRYIAGTKRMWTAISEYAVHYYAIIEVDCRSEHSYGATVFIPSDGPSECRADHSYGASATADEIGSYCASEHSYGLVCESAEPQARTSHSYGAVASAMVEDLNEAAAGHEYGALVYVQWGTSEDCLTSDADPPSGGGGPVGGYCY